MSDTIADLGLDTLQPLALLRCQQDVHDAIRARIQELATPYECVELATGLTKGHVSKLCAQPALKGVGMQTLFLLAPELGTAVVLVDTGKANRELRKRLLALPKGPIKRRVRMTPELMREAARRYGAMGRGIKKAFRSEEAMREQRRLAGIASGRSRRKLRKL